MDIESLKKMDYEYSYKLATLIGMDSPIRRFFQIATLTGTFFAWSIFLLTGYFVFDNHRIEIISIAMIFAIMLIPVFILKQTIRRKRPEYRDTRFASVIFDHYSFPSGHATRATYIAIMMLFYTPHLWWLWVIWALIMIFSRLIVGVHYISDIIAGIFIGSTCIIIIILLGWVPIFPYSETILKYLTEI